MNKTNDSYLLLLMHYSSFDDTIYTYIVYMSFVLIFFFFSLSLETLTKTKHKVEFDILKFFILVYFVLI